MKYNEAIDMILDGGEAYKKSDDNYHYSFIFHIGKGRKILLMKDVGISGEWDSPVFTQEDFTETDWIVEKDGLVYEEAPNGTPPIVCIASRLHEHDEPAELNGSSPIDDVYKSYKELHDIINKKGHEFVKNYAEEQERKAWKEIKLECIADKVNEDLLEKKMLCFVLRMQLPGNPGVKQSNYKNESGTCCQADCPFCFPEEKPKEICACTQIGGERIMCAHCVKRYIEKSCEADELANSWELHPEDKGADFEMQEVKCEKVTVIELLELVNKLSSGDLNPNRELNMYRHRHIINKRREILDIFEQKLEYLVSLQGE